MSLATPVKLRELQSKLKRKAKDEPEYGFYQLYDKVYRSDILEHAWRLAKANNGAPGVDQESFEEIEKEGLEEWLKGIGKELHDRTYEACPVRRKMIDKQGGGERRLGIPTASANCTGVQIAFRMGGDPPSIPSVPRPALPGFEGAPHSRY